MDTPSLWQEQHPGRRFPSVDGAITADVCVVGAGVTGCACAWRLLEHGIRPVIVDARRTAAGASGRNGGFAVSDSSLDPVELTARLGAARAAELLGAVRLELEAMIALAGELGVADAVQRTGSLWVTTAQEAREMAAAADMLRLAGVQCAAAPELIPEPMRASHPAALHVPGDASLLPARWVRTLAEAVAARGGQLYERSAAVSVRRSTAGWTVTAGTGTVTADAVVVACDGLIPRLLPELEGIVYPVRGQVAATAPLAHQPLSMPTHSQYGFMYYRPTPDGRVVIGGGRLEHLEEEYTDEERVTPGVQAEIDRFMAGPLGLAGVEVTHRWAGIMGFSADLLPLAGELPGRPGVHVAGGYSGVGNVLGHLCGRLVAELIATGGHPLAGIHHPDRFDPSRPPEQLEKQRSRELARTLGAEGGKTAGGSAVM
ncbi:MAG TPA: FAD-dependent oxidoreductase [Gaiellales bacterium]|nr:FAD-dependent oxidoreductase [Gaiellales bacterium]